MITKKEIKIIEPSPKEVKRYLNKWDSLDNYVLQESSLRKLFSKTYPLNTNMDDILIKVCSLNDFYSTNIFSPFIVARHILKMRIDKRLKNNDLSVVNDIAKIRMPGGRHINFYSFATKYCSHHKPTVYPIYDSFVEKMLMYFKKRDKFFAFKRRDLKNYEQYRQILEEFRKYFKLTAFDLKQIDKYLWQAGKKYFPKDY